jgi:DNA primase
LVYKKVPIVDTARRCGLVIDSWTLRRSEVEASCPFCGDRGVGKHHLSLNTDTDQYRCNLCGAKGNSITLYARMKGISNKQAYQELKIGGNVYPIPQQPTPQKTERQPLPLEARHAAYTDMLEHLTLLDRHGENLLNRGLTEERIRRNQYRSMPETERGRRLLAGLLRAQGHELLGLPGFRTCYGDWTVSGPNGFLIPVRNKDGLIQGLKIRLDDESAPNRKYRWFSSRDMAGGTRSRSWIHITGDTAKKRAYLTEGPLKGDAASFLAKDALFVCIGGVNALGGLKDTILDLGVAEVVEAMDMDQMTNPNVRKAVLALRREVQSIKRLKYTKYTWNPAYKGVDDYLLSCAAGA